MFIQYVGNEEMLIFFKGEFIIRMQIASSNLKLKKQKKTYIIESKLASSLN